MFKTVAVGGILIGAVLTACGGDDTSALRTQVAALQTQVAPDRVVGIEWRCTLAAKPSETGTEYRGTHACAGSAGGDDIGFFAGAGGQLAWNRRLELTIRTSNGMSYTVNVSPAATVALGDPWPPK